MISTRDNLKQPSHKCIHSDKLKNQSTCIVSKTKYKCNIIILISIIKILSH